MGATCRLKQRTKLQTSPAGPDVRALRPSALPPPAWGVASRGRAAALGPTDRRVGHRFPRLECEMDRRLPRDRCAYDLTATGRDRYDGNRQCLLAAKPDRPR